ncbi:MAG: hypothetical protein ACOCV1_06595, partial [Bacillota bacterium]
EDYEIIYYDTESFGEKDNIEKIEDGDPFLIIGINNNNKKPLKNLVFSNFEILFSLLKLLDKPLPNPYIVSWFTNDDLKKLIPLENIINWVDKYGLPYDSINKKYRKNNLKHHYSKDEKNIENAGISIATFRRIIVMFNARFNFWHATIYNDQETLDKLKIFEILFGKDKKLTSKERLLDLFFTKDYRIKPEYNEESDEYELMIYANSLIEVAEFQFYNLLTKEENYNKKHINICNYCGDYFWSNDSRQKFCTSKCRKNNWYHKNK